MRRESWGEMMYDKPSSIHIGKVVRDATVFNSANWAQNNLNNDSLLQAVARLFALLREREVDFVLVGGIALLSYVEGRNTEDIDLIIATDDLKKISEITIISRDADFARGEFGDLKIDFLLTQNKLFDKVRRENSIARHFLDQDVLTATVEGLLLLKLYALPSLYRLGEFAKVGIYENDAATLIQAYHPPLAPLLKELRQHLRETDMAELRTIVEDIEKRIAKFNQKNEKNRRKKNK